MTRDRWGEPPGTGPWAMAAELGCLALGLALAVSSARLFEGAEPVRALGAVATVGWLLALLLRRSPLPAVLGELAHLVLGALALLWLAVPAARWGLLPTADSLTGLADVVRSDFSSFAEDVAPIEMGTGHLVVLGALCWLLALFVSTAAMRLRTPVQAAIPHTATVIGLGLVSRDSGRVAAAAALVVALGAYALTQALWRNAALPWVPDRIAGRRAPIAPALGILAVAALGAALVTPSLPGGSTPVIDVKNDGGGGTRTVVSPFVEIGAQLGPSSDTLLFTVSGPEPSYWRLTGLDTYDEASGRWVFRNSYDPVDGPLTRGADATSDYRIDILGLGGIWVPAPEGPVTVDSATPLNWDGNSRSLVTDRGTLANGDSIAVAASGMPPPATNLNAADTALREVGVLPPELDAQLAQWAGLPERDAALALQTWLRSFTYDESVAYESSPNGLQAFINAKRGFCQQFATAFALGARRLGIPARVVVGFTTGDPIEPGPDGTPRWAVRGRHAHAWPEVLIDGTWLSFEPTPGRGNPATTDLTGVPPAQASPPVGSDPEEDVPPPTPTSAPDPTAGQEPSPPRDIAAGTTGDAEADGATADPQEGGGMPVLAVLAAVVAALAGLAWAVGERRRRRDAAPTDPVREAWESATEILTRRNLAPQGTETPNEYAMRATTRLRRAGVDLDGLQDLARLEARRRWSAEATDDEAARAARDALERVGSSLPG